GLRGKRFANGSGGVGDPALQIHFREADYERPAGWVRRPEASSRMTCMPASPQYSFVVEGGNSSGIATHFFRTASSSGSSIRIEVNPSQSHCRPVPLTNASIVSATCSRVLFISLPPQ